MQKLSDLWINTKTRLPEEDEMVIIHWGNGNIEKCRFFKDDKGEMVWKVPTFNKREAYEFPLEYATHWMPLPPSPETKE